MVKNSLSFGRAEQIRLMTNPDKHERRRAILASRWQRKKTTWKRRRFLRNIKGVLGKIIKSTLPLHR